MKAGGLRNGSGAARGVSKRLLHLTSLLGAAAALAGCSGTGVLNTLSPKGGLVIARDLAYAPGDRHGLDVYAPRAAAGHAPLVVFFYGGGWDAGAKADYAFVGSALARRGYVAVVPDYRLYPQVRWPAFLQDNAQAVRWARDHARDYGADPGKLFLMGHSAGAYNAMMLTLDRRWLGAVGMDPKRDLRGTVGLAGPYDFLPLTSEELKAIFGPPEQRPDTQPIDHVEPGRIPPLFLGVDEGDKVVMPKNTYNLAAKVSAVGGEVEVKTYKGLSHALLVAAIAAPLRFLVPVLKDTAAFIDAHAADAQAAGETPR